ncbi:SPOR domain-containing protein [Brachybacterium paraconglomeratum]
MTEGTQYYYNLSTGTVEEGAQSPATERMGPYATREEAECALSTAAQRNQEWEEDDKQWEEG